MNKLLSLLLLTCAACLPDRREPPPPPDFRVVVVADTSRWAAGELLRLRADYAAPNFRLLITGYPGETAPALTARLPWLLQPGVDRFLYDTISLPPAGLDSLRRFLERSGHPASVDVLALPRE